jgi:phosphoribosylglycinamide formyltransferase-1
VTVRLGVLVSGSGSNLGAILAAISAGELDAEVGVVISNKPGVRALERAADAGVPTEVLSHRDYASREAYDRALAERLRAARVEWVVLAGFMRIVTKELLDAFPERVLNIHPALLPAFPGVDAQAQALAYGVRITGCTVHLVDAGVDTGPIVAQVAVPVLPGDDRERLAARILVEEHRLYVEVLRAIAAGRLLVEQATAEGGRKRAWLEASPPGPEAEALGPG